MLRADASRVKVSLFDQSAVSSSRPAFATTSRADAVKDGRRCAAAAHSTVARPRLDGGEHDVILVGQDDRQHPEKQSCFNGCYELRAFPLRRRLPKFDRITLRIVYPSKLPNLRHRVPLLTRFYWNPLIFQFGNEIL